MRNSIVIIPAFNPDDKLIKYIDALTDADFHIIIVNDGSSVSSEHILKEIRLHTNCDLIEHSHNMGKGCALKNGFSYYRYKYSQQYSGVITADADGQHTLSDVLALDSALSENHTSLILGSRDFTDPEIPRRSRFGNNTTSAIFRLLYGVKIQDTQTGARAIPNALLDICISTTGKRFEYETNMLISVIQHHIPIVQIAIHTIYLNDNQSSHFRPVRDSLIIYAYIFKSFLKFSLSSLSSCIIDIGLFSLFLYIFGSMKISRSIILATICARILSSLWNFIVNRKLVFDTSSGFLNSIVKYYTLCICQMIVSAYGVSLLVGIIHGNAVVIKIIVDTLLFLISYQIQRKWVFKKSC